MQQEDLEQLINETKAALAESSRSTFAIVGHTPETYDLLALFRSTGSDGRLLGVYTDSPEEVDRSGLHRQICELATDQPDVALIASDEDKERLIEIAVPWLRPQTRLIFAGHRHFEFRDAEFDAVVKSALVPSLANGYPNSLVHLYQCLRNAARLELDGVVVEFGMFKGGTTMLLSQFIESLGRSWPVIGFDTFAGFPEKRHVLDMYRHPDCVYHDEDRVRRHVSGRDVEVVAGDVVTTVQRLAKSEIVLAFIDTDNFTSASAILDVIQDQIVLGGSIVFDHFTGRNRFRYTLGERFAAKRLLDDSRYFNLHDTGVFLRQR